MPNIPKSTATSIVLQTTAAPSVTSVFVYKGNNLGGLDGTFGNPNINGLIINLSVNDTDTAGGLSVIGVNAGGDYVCGIVLYVDAPPLAAVDANVTQILGTPVTEGAAGRLAGSFTHLLDVAAPTGTLNSLPAAVPGANNGLPILGANVTSQAVSLAVSGGAQAITITSAGGDAVLIQSAGTNKDALKLTSTGSGFGIEGSLSGVASLPTANQNADALLDRADAIETGLTVRECLRLLEAASAGKVAISGNMVLIRNTPDDKTRMTVTTTAAGERTAVTYDVS